MKKRHPGEEWLDPFPYLRRYIIGAARRQQYQGPRLTEVVRGVGTTFRNQEYREPGITRLVEDGLRNNNLCDSGPSPGAAAQGPGAANDEPSAIQKPATFLKTAVNSCMERAPRQRPKAGDASTPAESLSSSHDGPPDEAARRELVLAVRDVLVAALATMPFDDQLVCATELARLEANEKKSVAAKSLGMDKRRYGEKTARILTTRLAPLLMKFREP